MFLCSSIRLILPYADAIFRRRLTQLRSQYAINRDKGLIEDPHPQCPNADVEELHRYHFVGKKYFHFSLYADDVCWRPKMMKRLSNTPDVMLSGRNIQQSKHFYVQNKDFIGDGSFCTRWSPVLLWKILIDKGLSTHLSISSNSRRMMEYFTV